MKERLGRTQDGLHVKLRLVHVDAGAHEAACALEEAGHLLHQGLVFGAKALAQRREVLALGLVLQGLEPLFGARAYDVLDLGREPQEHEEMPEPQVDVYALAVLACAREVYAVVEVLARDAAPAEAREDSDRGLGGRHDVAADARPLGLLRGFVHGRDARLDSSAGLGYARLLCVHSYSPGVSTVPALYEVLLEVALAEHVVGLAEHEAHKVVLVLFGFLGRGGQNRLCLHAARVCCACHK